MKRIGLAAAGLMLVVASSFAAVHPKPYANGLESEASARAGVSRTREAAMRLNIDSVKLDLDVMASSTAQLRQEQMRCVERFRVEQAPDGVSVVHLLKLAPAELATSDSMSIELYKTAVNGVLGTHVCGDSLPVMHSHMVLNGKGPYGPSKLDYETFNATRAPFGIVMGVTNDNSMGFVIYGQK